MFTHMLSPDTQAILLLCASFGQNRKIEPQPLTLSEYNAVAGWLLENDMSPGDLLNPTLKNRLSQITISKLSSDRLVALLERGVMLSLSVEKWTNQGLWLLGRSDAQYPKSLKQKLKHSAPAILYGIGNIELLSQGGLVIVGSRDVEQEALDYTKRVVQTCAKQGVQIVSGGARGVDQASMLGVLEAGGMAVGVLADGLSKAAVAGKYRAGIKEGRLTLVSPYDPHAHFNTGNAMGRNKYIYALGDYALVVSSSVNRGGTWAGATEALEKIKNVPVFVRMQENVPEGNNQLLKKGASIFPEEPWNNSLRKILLEVTSKIESNKTEVKATALHRKNGVSEPLEHPVADIYQPKIQPNPKDIIYQKVLPIIISYLQQPLDDKYLAECLDIQRGQMQNWLKRAVAEGKVIKTKNPVKYIANQKLEQLSLLD